jgi:hypothetical protein
MIDPDKILFRASSVGKIMGNSKNLITDKQLETIDELQAKRKLTDNQEKELRRLIEKRDNPDTLSETCKTYLRELYKSVKYQREKIVTSKYLEHGIQAEESAISLLSLEKGIFLKKNKERLFNRYVTGEPDVYLGPSIKQAEEGYDTKVCFSLFTLPDKKVDQIDPDYFFQNIVYCALTGAKQWTTAYTLVNASASLIQREKERIFYMLNTPDDSDEEYMRRKIEIEKAMIFDLDQFKKDNPFYDMDCKDWTYDIPRKERLVEYTVHRDSQVIQSIYDRVEECRKWIKDNLL